MSEAIATALRHFNPCQCEYQKEHNWRYAVYGWNRDSKSWQPAGVGEPAEALDIASRHKRVLIVCRGCGSEMIRECHAKRHRH